MKESGKIWYSAWGYGQTNVDFYLETRRTASTVWLKGIKHDTFKSEKSAKLRKGTRPTYKAGCGWSMPRPKVEFEPKYLPRKSENVDEFMCRLRPDGSCKIDRCISGSEWDGKPVYESWYY